MAREPAKQFPPRWRGMHEGTMQLFTQAWLLPFIRWILGTGVPKTLLIDKYNDFNDPNQRRRVFITSLPYSPPPPLYVSSASSSSMLLPMLRSHAGCVRQQCSEVFSGSATLTRAVETILYIALAKGVGDGFIMA